MKKVIYIVVFLVVLLGGCGKSVDPSASTALPPEETVQTLFEEAANTIKDFVTEDPRDALDMDFDRKAMKKNIDSSYDYGEPKAFNSGSYFQTALTYQQAVEHYSEIFTGKALDSFLSRFFYDVDGALYVTGVGGMSGFGIENIKVTLINQSVGVYSYQAAYDHVTEFETSHGESHFSVKSVDGNYRISDIDYLSD